MRRIAFVMLMLAASPCLAGDTGWRSCTASNFSTGNITWTVPGSSGTLASWASGRGGFFSDDCLFQADLSDLPAGVTILGVEVRIRCHSNTGSGTSPLTSYAYLSGSRISGSDFSLAGGSPVPTGSTEYSFGGAADNWAAFTRDQLADPTFGFSWAVICFSDMVYVEAFEVRVYHDGEEPPADWHQNGMCLLLFIQSLQTGILLMLATSAWRRKGRGIRLW